VNDSQRCNNGIPQLCVSNNWQAQTACTASEICQSGACVTPPSCDGLGADCGSSGDDNCCASAIVPGGSFHRNNSGTYPATVSDFMLDRYEVTVGRFRQFLAGYPANSPVAGDGAHPWIADSGWNTTWDTYLAASASALATALECDNAYTWTDSAGINENKPINCLDWYHAFAFCAWDGGFLPSDLEWNYAAAGGDDQRVYPWGSTMPTANTSYAIYDCYYGGGSGCPQGDAHIAPVGSATLGPGKWAHLDLAGNVEEWTLDAFAAYPAECVDCADLTDSSSRVKRGGSFMAEASTLLTSQFSAGTGGDSTLGLRCARSP
jgi:formylglycine-generating enzyme required for sulfatase activity